MANNIITAAYSSSNITYTKPAYQYDYGMILKFSGIELPQAYEVHFSNTEFCGNSITQIGGVDGVTIPDEMFLSGNPIYAWTYLHTGADDGETVYKAVISINKRAKPSNKTPTPVQQDAITQAIAALNVAVEQTAADVVAAGESAEAAAGSAETAGQAKDDAVEAQGKAEDAQEAAENAQEAAETAQGKAEDAQEAAEQAAGAVLGLTADASVDANTGTPSVEVNVSTVSDHKNMSFSFHNLKGVPGDPGEPGDDGFSPVVSVSSITGGHEVAVTDKNGTQTFDVMDGTDGEDGVSPTVTVTEISGGHNVEITDAQGTQDFDVMDGEISEEQLETALIDKADVITSTASGEIITIADGAKNLPVVDLKVSLLPVQSGSGDPSPDNIRPISGWTGVEVYRSDADTSNPTTYPISWQSSAGTVYGGTVNPVTGLLNDEYDWAIADASGNLLHRGGSALSGSGYRSGGYVLYVVGQRGDVVWKSNVCNIYKTGTALDDDGSCYVYNSSSDARMTFRDTSIPGWTEATSNAALFSAFKTYVANQYALGNVLFATWKVTNPTTTQLSPTQIRSLFGVNTFWSNGNGTLDLEYRADTKLYIEQLTKPTEDDMTANQNITASSFFMVGNRLFLSTVAIAQGATIIPGTNCTEISLADALNSLNS